MTAYIIHIKNTIHKKMSAYKNMTKHWLVLTDTRHYLRAGGFALESGPGGRWSNKQEYNVMSCYHSYQSI